MLSVIQKKIKEPNSPYINIEREKVFSYFDGALEKNYRFLYLQGFSGYGKTHSITSYFNKNKQFDKVWYLLDEWDKDNITFLRYLYTSFKKKFPDLPNNFEEFFSQPLNSEKILKRFIGLLCNELEAIINQDTFLILDNFQEVESEPLILAIINFLFTYCPDKLKIIILSTNSLPEELYNFYLKQELFDFPIDSLPLEINEAQKVFEKLNVTDKNIIEELLKTSNKCISIFSLLAQNYSKDNSFFSSYKESKIYKVAIREITRQIFDNLSDNIKDFILTTVLLPKLSKKITEYLTNSNDLPEIISTLKSNEIIFYEENKDEINYNQVFLPIFEEIFFELETNIRESILEKIFLVLKNENVELLLQVAIKAKLNDKAVSILEKNYEYYFRNYLYSTLEKILKSLNSSKKDDYFLDYLLIRLERSKGKFSQSLDKIKQLNLVNNYPLIELEEGICYAGSGKVDQAINKLESLEKQADFSIKDQLTLINSLGVSYLHAYKLDLALKYFKKAIELKDRVDYKHDLIKIYHNMGLNYTWKGDFNNAVSSYEQSLFISKQLNVSPLAMTHNNIAVIHNLQGEYEKSYQSCLKGIEIANFLENKRDNIYLNITLINTYIGLKNTYKVNETINYLEELLSNLQNDFLYIQLLKQKSKQAVFEKNYDNAIDYISQAINIRKLSENNSALVEDKLDLGCVEYYKGSYKESVETLSEIEDNVKKGGHKYHLSRIYLYKYFSYNKLNDSKNKKLYYDKALSLIMENDYKDLILKINSIGKESKLIEEKAINHKSHQQIKIITLDGFSVSFNEITLEKKDWSGKKTRLLFLYLLLNKSGVTKEKLFNALFPDGDKSRSALHVLINRLRKALSKLMPDDKDINLITFSDDLYKFNFSIDYWWDAERFESFVNEAKLVKDKDSIFKLKEKALSIYKGSFMDGLEIEDWIYTTQSYYRSIAISIFEEISDVYLNNSSFEKLRVISSQFLNIDSCYEKACQYNIKALLGLNKKKEALDQFKRFERSLKKILSEKPSNNMLMLRNSILD